MGSSKTSVIKARVSKVHSMCEKVQKAVRSSVLNGVSVAIPSTVKTADHKRKFKNELNEYTILNSDLDQDVEIRKVNDEIGVGIFAVRPLKKGEILKNIWGKFGKRLNEAKSTILRSTVFNDETERYNTLMGPVSFLTMRVCNMLIVWLYFPNLNMDYKGVQTVRRIQANSELTLCYSEYSNLVCRSCK